MQNEQLELLSPAGDWERLEAAVRFGADAVYLGGKEFGMRASPLNFTEQELAKAVAYCHEKQRKVYVTCNTLPREDEISKLPDYLKMLGQIGVDAVIVADMGVLALCKKIIPHVTVHISTQTGIVNSLAATELHAQGAKRVVLARELSLEEILSIRKNTPPDLELEAFVHGAMCMSVSGRCVLSNYLTGRDANRGECAQPCRWNYFLMEQQRPGEFFSVFEDENGSYILNAKDLCMIEHIKLLADVGITSFKIEGRAKSFYYVASVTHAYRAALDAFLAGETLPQWVLDEPQKVSHRPYSTGFYFDKSQAGQCLESGGYIREYDVVAVVDDCREKSLFVTQRNRFFSGDELEVLTPGEKPWTLQVGEILDETGSPVESARHAMQKLVLPGAGPVPKGAILRKQLEK